MSRARAEAQTTRLSRVKHRAMRTACTAASTEKARAIQASGVASPQRAAKGSSTAEGKGGKET